METYKMGVWTPWARVTCYDCHGNENLPNPKTQEEWQKAIEPQELKYGNAVTFCDDCHADVQVDASVAYEHNLVRALQEQGIDAVMAQTGGMMSAACIPVSEAERGEGGPDVPYEILITYDDSGDSLYWMGVYDSELSGAEVEWGNQSFRNQDEVLEWMKANRDKVAVREPLMEGKTLDELVNEAKKKAAEKNVGHEGKGSIALNDPER